MSMSQDWERLRHVITKLYIDEDKTVDEVKRYMEEHYGFSASCVSPRSMKTMIPDYAAVSQGIRRS